MAGLLLMVKDGPHCGLPAFLPGVEENPKNNTHVSQPLLLLGPLIVNNERENSFLLI